MNSKTSSTGILNNMIWRFMERCGAQVVTFVLSVVLARLLDPEVYGTVALVTVFTTILQVFVDSGLGNALIQKKDADDLDFSSVFYVNIVICSVLYIGICIFSPLIASFYKRPELVPIICAVSFIIVISGVRNIQQAYISKNMMFKKFFFSTLGGSIASAVVGIGMALLGYGVWALVAQLLINSAVGTVILWITVKWRPKAVFSFERVKVLFSYGWKLLASSLLETVYNNIRQLIIGKFYSTGELAFYNKGKQLPNLIITNINASIDSVLLPSMSQEQDDKTRVKAMTRRAIRTSTYIMAPMLVGLAACGAPLITLLLTEKWLPCVFFMQIFCITFVFYPIHTANLNAIKAMGRSDIFLKLEIAKKFVGFGLVVATMFISVKAMAYSAFAGTLLSTIINAFPNKKLLGYSWLEQMKDILPNIALSFVMGISVYFMQRLPLPTIIVLILQVMTGAIIYIGLSWLLKMEIFNYIVNMIKHFLRTKKNSENE